jgi:uncharacterized membrane protein
MIQRIQTVWLLLAGIAAFLTLKLPYYVGIQDPIIPYHEMNAINAGTGILAVTLAVGIVSLVAIGLYKNRTTQLRLCVVGIVLESLLIFLYYSQVAGFSQGTFALTSILHMCIMLFFLLAARAINKDEKLIRGSDRLR